MSLGAPGVTRWHKQEPNSVHTNVTDSRDGEEQFISARLIPSSAVCGVILTLEGVESSEIGCKINGASLTEGKYVYIVAV